MNPRRLQWLWLEWAGWTGVLMLAGISVLAALVDGALSLGDGLHEVPNEWLLVILGGLAGTIVGGIVGAGQGACLYRRFGLPWGRWIAVTAAGSALGWALTIAANLALVAADSGSQETLLAFVIGGFGSGALVGTLQWWVLSGEARPSAAWWIPANGAAWVVAAAIVWTMWNGMPFAADAVTAAVRGATATLLGGLASGLVTGLALHGLYAGWLPKLAPRGALSLIDRRRTVRAA